MNDQQNPPTRKQLWYEWVAAMQSWLQATQQAQRIEDLSRVRRASDAEQVAYERWIKSFNSGHSNVHSS
jgi:hypothetical protein